MCSEIHGCLVSDYERKNRDLSLAQFTLGLKMHLGRSVHKWTVMTLCHLHLCLSSVPKMSSSPPKQNYSTPLTHNAGTPQRLKRSGHTCKRYFKKCPTLQSVQCLPPPPETKYISSSWHTEVGKPWTEESREHWPHTENTRSCIPSV